MTYVNLHEQVLRTINTVRTYQVSINLAFVERPVDSKSTRSVKKRKQKRCQEVPYSINPAEDDVSPAPANNVLTI